MDGIPAGTLESPGEVIVARRYDDERDRPPLEDVLPALAAARHGLVVVPNRRREDLDPRVDRDRQRGQGELEP